MICYGLRADFMMKGFPGSTRLLELAHTIEEMKTICACGRKATCNGRKVNGQFVFEGEQIAIDTVDHVEYESLCPSAGTGSTAPIRSVRAKPAGKLRPDARRTICNDKSRTGVPCPFDGAGRRCGFVVCRA